MNSDCGAAPGSWCCSGSGIRRSRTRRRRGNASTRVFFAMGRTGGSCRRWLAKTHPRFKTPINAIAVQTRHSRSRGVGLSLIIGADQHLFDSWRTTSDARPDLRLLGRATSGSSCSSRTKPREHFNIVDPRADPPLQTVPRARLGRLEEVDEEPAPSSAAGYLDWVPQSRREHWVVVGVVLVIIMGRQRATPTGLQLAERVERPRTTMQLHDAGRPRTPLLRMAATWWRRLRRTTAARSATSARTCSPGPPRAALDRPRGRRSSRCWTPGRERRPDARARGARRSRNCPTTVAALGKLDRRTSSHGGRLGSPRRRYRITARRPDGRAGKLQRTSCCTASPTPRAPTPG